MTSFSVNLKINQRLWAILRERALLWEKEMRIVLISPLCKLFSCLSEKNTSWHWPSVPSFLMMLHAEIISVKCTIFNTLKYMIVSQSFCLAVCKSVYKCPVAWSTASSDVFLSFRLFFFFSFCLSVCMTTCLLGFALFFAHFYAPVWKALAPKGLFTGGTKSTPG